MNLQQRINLLSRLGEYMKSSDENWQEAKNRAYAENRWFIPEYIELASENIRNQFLKLSILQELSSNYHLPEENTNPKKVGIVMAGNIPMVGFHDLVCTFLTGHYAYVKLSSKDQVLIKHLIEKLTEWDPAAQPYFTISEMLKNCDAYIATGSNNSSRYFEYYFRNYPSIIRKNRTSVALLTGNESREDLEKLADDVFQYFGLGCRNVTKLYVPRKYDFIPLLDAFKKYDRLTEIDKYRNNYDYNLAIHILNNKYFMSTKSLLLVEEKSPFSPIGQLNYEFYDDEKLVRSELAGNDTIQCIVGRDDKQFGEAQCPGIEDFADGVDTMKFLNQI